MCGVHMILPECITLTPTIACDFCQASFFVGLRDLIFISLWAVRKDMVSAGFILVMGGVSNKDLQMLSNQLYFQCEPKSAAYLVPAPVYACVSLHLCTQS